MGVTTVRLSRFGELMCSVKMLLLKLFCPAYFDINIWYMRACTCCTGPEKHHLLKYCLECLHMSGGTMFQTDLAFSHFNSKQFLVTEFKGMRQ